MCQRKSQETHFLLDLVWIWAQKAVYNSAVVVCVGC